MVWTLEKSKKYRSLELMEWRNRSNRWNGEIDRSLEEAGGGLHSCRCSFTEADSSSSPTEIDCNRLGQ
ncbi:hypothetical protein L6452_11685 [Arctium lappa]|uniref:Uncharacterized protein n=2 Tax=Arctium lappa TaxID=4217 RepID=A0ACB8Y8G7_ARCLA|nr:hypothetical protein L6452_35913 [Arctium lappa]KAI3748545.1 hypothetical protein L6452_11685 [Arctium lappa]